MLAQKMAVLGRRACAVAPAGLGGLKTTMGSASVLVVRHQLVAGGWRGFCSTEQTYDVVVFGGNGFVGSNVCRILSGMGKKVAAVNRSGAPRAKEDWMDGIDYIAADVFDPEAWRPVLQRAGGVVSSIGAFGSYEQMKRMNGDSNIVVAEEAAAAGVSRMVFVSASFPPFPASVPLRGYIEGKEAAEAVVRERFPDNHAILKPSVIFGKQENAHPFIAAIRALGPIQEPLMTNTPLSKLSTLPVVGGVFLPWSPVEAVARAAAEGATGPLPKLTLLPEDIAMFKR